MRKLAVFSAACAGAVFLCVYLLPENLWIPLGVTAVLLTPLALLLLRGRNRLLAGLICAGAALGLLWTPAYDALFFQPARAFDAQTIRLTATVLDYPVERDYGWQVSARMASGSGAGLKMVLYTDEQGAALRPGDEINTVAHMTIGTRSAAGEEISYYTAKGIFLWGQCYGELSIRRPGRIPINCWGGELAHRLRNGIAASFPEDTAPIVTAVVTGSREKLTDQFTSSLERTGLSHTIAVSGMHLSCFAGILGLLLGRGTRRGAVVVIVWSLLFCAIAGSTPSVSRAAVMIVMLQIAPVLRRERDSFTSLAFALMLLLLWNPYSAAHVGLQLSFAAVAGILLVSNRLMDICYQVFSLASHPKEKKVLRYGKLLVRGLCAIVCTTLGAMVATVPLTAIHFRTLSLIAPVTNLLTLWAVTGIFAGGMLVGVAGLFVPGIAQGLAVPVSFLARYVEGCGELFSRFPLAALSLDNFYYLAWLLLCYVLVLGALLLRGIKGWIIPACCALSTFCLCVTMNAVGYRSGPLTVTALDVGQGQSVLLRSGNSLVLVDCGGSSYDDPGDIAANFLQARGFTRVDLLVLTHCHADHANGVPQLLRRLPVDRILLPRPEEEDELFREIVSLAQTYGTTLQYVTNDTEVAFSQGGKLILYPPMAVGEDLNEQGLALLVNSGEFDALITGDMGGLTERRLLRYAELPQVELLVAGHHGAKTSTSQQLLDAIKPEVCLISVGAHNRYGHPSGETLERLHAAGTEIYRTDLNGPITLQVN